MEVMLGIVQNCSEKFVVKIFNELWYSGISVLIETESNFASHKRFDPVFVSWVCKTASGGDSVE